MTASPHSPLNPRPQVQLFTTPSVVARLDGQVADPADQSNPVDRADGADGDRRAGVGVDELATVGPSARDFSRDFSCERALRGRPGLVATILALFRADLAARGLPSGGRGDVDGGATGGVDDDGSRALDGPYFGHLRFAPLLNDLRYLAETGDTALRLLKGSTGTNGLPGSTGLAGVGGNGGGGGGVGFGGGGGGGGGKGGIKGPSVDGAVEEARAILIDALEALQGIDPLTRTPPHLPHAPVESRRWVTQTITLRLTLSHAPVKSRRWVRAPSPGIPNLALYPTDLIIINQNHHQDDTPV